MQIAIQSPVSPLLPPGANRLYVFDNWNNALGVAPQFAYKLQNVNGEVVTDLKYDSVQMTALQWTNWGAGGDDSAYILGCLVPNLGLVAA